MEWSEMKEMSELVEEMIGLNGGVSKESDRVVGWREKEMEMRIEGRALRENLVVLLGGVGGDGCCVHNLTYLLRT